MSRSGKALVARLLLWSFTLAFVLASVLIAVLLTVDPSAYRGQIQTLATQALGREVTLAGPLSIERSLRPALLVEDITIGNPEWASRPHFARAGRLEIRVALLPLLTGEVEIRGLAVGGADVLLEEGPGEENNWTFAEDTDDGPSGLPELGTLTVRDSTLGYRTVGGETHRLDISRAQGTSRKKGPVELSAEATYRDLSFALELTGGAPKAYGGPGKSWPIELRTTTADASLHIEGRMAGPDALDDIDLAIALSGERLDTLAPLVDMSLPKLGPYGLSGRVTDTRDGYSVESLRLRLGETELGGTVHWLADGDRPRLAGAIHAPRIQVQELMAAFPEGAKDEMGASPWDQTLPTEGLRVLDLDLELQAEEIVVPHLPVRDVSASIRLSDGRLAVEPLQASQRGSRVAAHLVWDASGTEPALLVEAQAERTDIGPGGAERPGLAGTVEGMSLRLAGTGETPGELLASSSLALRLGPADLRYAVPASRRVIPIQIASAEVSASPEQALSLAVEGQIDDAPAVVKLSAGQLRQLAEAPKPWPVQLSAQLAGNVLEAEGNVSEPLGAWGLALDTALHGSKLASLNRVLGTDLPRVGPYRLKGRLKGAAGGYDLEVTEARLGRSDMAGSFQWSHSGKRPLLKVRARSSVVDVDELLAGRDQEPTRADEPPLAEQPFPRAALRRVDLNVGLEVNRLVSRSAPLRKLSVSARLEDGLLRATPVRASLDGHRLETELEVDARKETPTVAFNARVAKIDLGRTLRRLTDSRVLTGTVNGVSLALEGAGQTYRELTQAASLRLATRTASLTYRDTAKGRMIPIAIDSSALTAQPGEPLRVTASGTVRKEPVELTLTGAPTGKLLEGSGPIRVHLSPEGGPVRVVTIQWRPVRQPGRWRHPATRRRSPSR